MVFVHLKLELYNKTELFEWLINSEGEEISGFSKVLYSRLTIVYTARLVAKIIESHKNLNGIYNVASKPINKSELLYLINDNFDLILIINENQRIKY